MLRGRRPSRSVPASSSRIWGSGRRWGSSLDGAAAAAARPAKSDKAAASSKKPAAATTTKVAPKVAPKKRDQLPEDEHRKNWAASLEDPPMRRSLADGELRWDSPEGWARVPASEEGAGFHYEHASSKVLLTFRPREWDKGEAYVVRPRSVEQDQKLAPREALHAGKAPPTISVAGRWVTPEPWLRQKLRAGGWAYMNRMTRKMIMERPAKWDRGEPLRRYRRRTAGRIPSLYAGA